MKPYDMDDFFSALYDLVDDSEEEDQSGLQSECKARLEQANIDRDEALANLWRWARNTESDFNATKAEKLRLERKQRVLSSRLDWIKSLIAMVLGPGNKWQEKDGVAGFGWRKSKGVVIDDARIIPDAWCKIERVPVLTEIKKTIEEGGAVPGAKLEERQNLQVK